MPALCQSCSSPLPAGSMAGVCPACLLMGAQVLAEEPPETVLRHVAGYDLLERIGRGGMGVVYKARHAVRDRIVALKMVSAGELAAPDVLRRFKVEAESAARLQHRGIVSIYEAGEHDGLPFYSMEYVPGGRTLAGLIAEKPMPAHAAAACLEKVARAVQHAHEHGVLHRDLKPSNILLDEQGDPRVADFGLARQLDADSSLTLSRNALGSPAYMPPEQAGGRSAEAGPASDVYSLGAVLYHCLTGRPPFAGESVETVLMQVREAEPVPPRRLNASVPRELDNIVLKCLEKSPARRYHSAAALAEELSRWLRGEPVLARPVSTVEKLRRWTRRHRGVAAMLVALLIALGIGAALMVHSNRLLAGGKREVEIALKEKSNALDGQTRALADALISRAESAARGTGQPGQRSAALEAIQQAAALPLSPDEKFRARNAAITAMALPEAVWTPAPHLPAPSDWTMCLCSPDLKTWARAEFDGKVSIYRTDGSMPPRHFNLAPRRIDCLLRMDAAGKLLAFRYDRTRLGVLPFSAEPWPDPSTFRPTQVSFATWNFTLGPLGIPSVSNDITLIGWPEPDGTIRMADAMVGLRLLTWAPPVPDSACTTLQFSPDNRLVAATRGNPPRLEVMEMPTGTVRNTRPLSSPAISLSWVNWSGRIGIGLESGRVQVDDPFPDTRSPGRNPGYDAHTLPIASLAFVGGGLLSTSEDGTTRLWNRRSPWADFTIPASSWHLELDSSNKKAGPFLKGGSVGFYTFESSQITEPGGNSMHGESSGPHCVMPNGRAIALLHREGIEFYRTIKYSTRNRVLMSAPICAVASPRSDWLLLSQKDRLTCLPITWPKYGINPGEAKEVMTGVKRVTSLSLSKDGSRLAMADEGRHMVTLHSLTADGTVIGPASMSIPFRNVMACALSPDGSRVAAGSALPLQITVHQTSVPEQPPVSLSTSGQNWHPVFSSDGKWLALSGRTCQLYAADTLAPGPELDVPPNGAEHHGASFYCPPNQPDRCLLAVAGADREIHLFRIRQGPPATAEKLAILRLPDQSFLSAPAFDEKGNLTVAMPRAQLATWSLPTLVKELRALSLHWQ